MGGEGEAANVAQKAALRVLMLHVDGCGGDFDTPFAH
jgi:hypothetical protein